jgi:hypothetical protein
MRKAATVWCAWTLLFSGLCLAGPVLTITVTPGNISAAYDGEGVSEFAPYPANPEAGDWFSLAAVAPDGAINIAQIRIELVVPPFIFEVAEACVDGVGVAAAKPPGTPLTFTNCVGSANVGLYLNGVPQSFDTIEWQDDGPPGAGSFTVFCRDAADHDMSGAVAVPDIFAYLSDWFAGSPRADCDTDGVCTVPDIFGFLTAWFGGV